MLDGVAHRNAERRAQQLLQQAALLEAEAESSSSLIVAARKRADALDKRRRALALQARPGVLTA